MIIIIIGDSFFCCFSLFLDSVFGFYFLTRNLDLISSFLIFSTIVIECMKKWSNSLKDHINICDHFSQVTLYLLQYWMSIYTSLGWLETRKANSKRDGKHLRSSDAIRKYRSHTHIKKLDVFFLKIFHSLFAYIFYSLI